MWCEGEEGDLVKEEEEEDDEEEAEAAAAEAEAAAAAAEEEGGEEEEEGGGEEEEGVEGEEAGGDAEGADAGDGLTKLARQQSLLPKAEVDNALWNGAADEGWIVRDEVPVFKAPVLAAPTSAAEAAAMPEMVAKAEAEAKEAEAAMDKDPVRRYVGPSGTLYPTVERAVVAREAEATARLQRQVKTPAGQAALARSHPYALVGWRVSVYWKEEGGEGEAGAAAGDALADYSGGWYTGQVTEYLHRLLQARLLLLLRRMALMARRRLLRLHQQGSILLYMMMAHSIRRSILPSINTS